jgi:hypothetical protein
MILVQGTNLLFQEKWIHEIKKDKTIQFADPHLWVLENLAKNLRIDSDGHIDSMVSNCPTTLKALYYMKKFDRLIDLTKHFEIGSLA